ncbi:MAG: zf-HC2 domain-containing protein [Blastocatellales bacterium]
MNSKNNRFNAPNDCGRKEDLVAYLYDEASVAERASFKRHLDDCDSCNNDLMAFGRVRDELSAWQVGVAPRTEVTLPRSRFDVLRELIGMFPVWVRGAALAGAAAAMLLLALSIAGTRISLMKSGDFAINFGRAENSATGATAVSSEEIEKLVQNAVARERENIERQYSAQLASFKDQLSEEHQAKLQAASAEHQERLKSVEAGLKREIQRTNRQNASIRSFFAMDDSNDPWGDVR